MKYAFLIYGDESKAPDYSGPEGQAVMAGYGTFTQEVMQNGAFSSGEALNPTATATTLRTRNGENLVTDGPFAETKEQLGGFYILECKDLDEALAYAAKIPHARLGAIEVRPVMPM